MSSPSHVCLVCGVHAARHVNYGARTCESCKVFFRRTALKKREYKCNKGSKCVISEHRHNCIACRYSRCLSIGMIPKLIHLKVLRTKASPTASSELPRPLTAYERKCLTDLERAGKVLPEELDLLAEGHEEPYDLDTLSQGMFAYLNFAARYANSFEWFRCLELSDRTRLMKTLYTALLSVRFAYNFDGDVHRIPCLSGDDGVKCQRMDWVQVLYMNTKEDDIVEALKESMFQMSTRVNKDRTIRNLMQMVLFTQSNQPVTCPQYLHYHHTFYLTLLRRYLQHKHRSTPKATEEYWHVYKIMELYHQRRVVADQLISKLDCSKMPHLLSEIYDLA